MKKPKKIEINLINDKERKPLDYDKKYFTDYHARYSKKNGEKSRKTIYDEQPLSERFHAEPIINLFKEDGKEKAYQGINGKDISINGIFAHLSLNELEYAINKNSANNYEYIQRRKNKNLPIKHLGLTISKGILDGGISPTKYYVKGSPYLFIDIDVKNIKEKKENIELHTEDGKPNNLNNKVFEFMKSISLLTARSSSGLGICSVLYCPFLEDIYDNRLHKEIALVIYDFINNELNPPVQIEFDENQAQFTLGRNFPTQLSNEIQYHWDCVKINNNAIEFDVKLTEADKEGCLKLKNRKNSKTKKDSISIPAIINAERYNSEYNQKEQVKIYNRENVCIDLFNESNIYELVNNENASGFTVFQKTGKNNKSVNVHLKNNYFKCFTSSLKGSTPFDLYTQLYFKGNSNEAYKSLLKSGDNKKPKWDGDDFYLDPREKEHMRYSLENINELLDYKHEFHGLYLNEQGNIYTQKLCIKNTLGISDRDIVLAIHEHYKKTGYEYPIYNFIKDKGITTSIYIEQYLTRELITDNCNSLINYIYAPCGIGKTTASLGNEKSKIDGIAVNNKVIFIVPRVAMVEQQSKTIRKKYNAIASTGNEKMNTGNNVSYIASIGSNIEKLYDKNNNLKSVITTYDQFVNIPNDVISQYDYVILDEAHLLSSDDYRESIPKTFLKLENFKNSKTKVKFILLSATPGLEILTLKEYFKEEFKIIEVQKKDKKNPIIKVHNINSKPKASNKKDAQIFKQIISDINESKKVVVYCENKEKIIESWNKFVEYCNSLCIPIPTKGFMTAKSKEMSIYKGIVEDEYLDSQVTYSTSVLNVGINITKGIEKGMSFIFDYTSNANFSAATSQLQLLFRNRNRNTTTHCFAHIMDKENPDIFKLFDEAKRDKNVSHYFREIKKSGHYKTATQMKGLNFNDVQFKNFDKYAECYIATSELEKFTKYDQRSLNSFIKLAIKHNCYIEYIYEKDEIETTIEGGNIVNLFVFNLLKKILKLNSNEHIRLINTQELKQGKIMPDVLINKTIYKREDYKNFYKCEYHPTFKSLEKKVTRCFNYLKEEYKGENELTHVLNFILNSNQSKKTIDKKLVDYINTHKTILKNNIITRVTVSELNNLKSPSKENIEYTIENTIPDKIRLFLSELVVNNEVDIKKMKLLNHELFKKAFEQHIKTEAKNVFTNLFKLRKEDKKNVLTQKRILSFKDENEITEIDLFKILSISNSKNTSLSITIFEKLTDELSKKYSSDALDDFKLKEYNYDKDYFNDSQNKKISKEEFMEKYKDNLIAFKIRPENKRVNFAFIVFNNETQEIIIEKNLEVLHAQLLERGILNKMMSLECYDYTKLNNFKKKEKTDNCNNYNVYRKISLNNFKS